MRKWTFLAVLSLFLGVSHARQLPQAAAIEKARLTVDLLLKGSYGEVVAMFDDTMKGKVTQETLNAGLGSALQKAGAMRTRPDPQARAVGDSQVVTLPIEFANAAMNFVVSFDREGRINGLWLRPQTAPVPVAAAKAGQAVDLVLQEKYAEVIAMFAPQLKAAVSEEKLRSGLQPILRSSGALRKRLEPDVQSSGGQSVVIISLQFEKAAWDLIVSVDAAGDLVGLLARPGVNASIPWAAPPYSKPGSFRTEEVTIGKGEWQLPGTLALPAGKARLAALVLVHGSGPNDRDESIGPQKPFRDLAEGLASRGIAVLRYEKRTRYAAAKLKSIQNFTVQDETVDDALAAVEFLRTRPEIDPAHVFVLGHSLGGYLLPRIGERDARLEGLISLAGAARPLEDLMVEQNVYLASLQGNPPQAQEQIKQIKADAQRIKELRADAAPAPGGMLFQAPLSYWLDLKGYDPTALARSLKQPMLILQGERDYQVTMTDFARWRDALKGRADVTCRSFPALNHLFQAGEGPKSTPGEYMAKPGHMAPEVIEEIATWIDRIAS